MSKTKKLGKGLSALISGDDLEKTLNLPIEKKTSLNEIKSSLVQLNVDEILPNPDQPRQIFEKEKIEELAKSIKTVGLIEPIIVTETNGKYYLIAGERRWRASKLAGFDSIPAIIKNDSRDNVLEIMLIENIQRENLSPIEEANSYQIILERKKITQENLAEFLGKSRTYITNLLRILNLPPEIKAAINDKTITVGHAKSMLGFTVHEQRNILEKIKRKNFSVRDVEKLAKLAKTQKMKWNEKNKISQLDTYQSDPHIEALKNKLREHFKTKINIKPLKDESGRIEIDFYNYDNLNAILEKMKIK